MSTIASMPDILNATVFRTFWISWENGFIRVGVGSVVGLGVFLQYTDTAPSPVNYMAVSGWDSPGTVVVNYGLYLFWPIFRKFSKTLHWCRTEHVASCSLS